MEPQLRARWIVAAAVFAALCLRLGFGLGYWVDRPLTHDEREYLGLARSLAQGRGLVHDDEIDIGTGQRFGRAPAYPAFLAAIGAGAIPNPASSPARVKIAQSVIGAAAVLLIALIAWRGAGPRAGATAAVIAAVYPSLVWSPAYVLSETLYSFVALAAALVLQIAVDRSRNDKKAGIAIGAGAGALIGAAVLVRPAMLLFIPLALLWLLTRRRAVMAVVMVAAVLAVVGPWTLRNWRVYGRFVLVASEGGVTFWTGNHPLSTGDGDLAANPALKEAEIAFRRQHPGLTPEELEPLYYRDALRTIANDPVWWLGLLARKAFYTVVPIGASYAVHSLRYRAASTLPYLVIVPFAVVGARRLWRAPSRPAAAFLLGAAAVLVNLLFFPQERFRIPVIDPALIVCASAATRQLSDHPS